MIVLADKAAYTATMPGKPHDPHGRPVFLGLTRIRFPVGAIASIAHRITGVLLAIAVPGAVALLARSASAPGPFQQVAGWLATPWAAVAVGLVAAAATHHLLAGLRIMAMDAGWLEGLTGARRTAAASLVGAAVVGIATVGGLLL
jgi:succinate dehydrogenase / fumarate reductase cytochrome b subunit